MQLQKQNNFGNISAEQIFGDKKYQSLVATISPVNKI
jgi:hypothetical protein